MYAVVKTGGKQLKVAVGETVSVELLAAEPGAVVTLPALFVSDGEKIMTGEEAAKATVTAEVLGHGKADKVLVFSFRKRKGSKKLRGHRQPLTLVKVTDIALPGAKPAKAAKAESPASTEEKPARKPAAKKAAPAADAAGETKPVRKPAAKKTTKPTESAE